MKQLLTFSIVLIFSIIQVSAQQDTMTFLPEDINSPTENDTVYEDDNIDSLMQFWFSQRSVDSSLGLPVEEITDSVIAEFPDSVYIRKIMALNSYIPLSYNKIVRNFIHVYTDKKRDKLESILGYIDYYFPFFESILDQHELPIELKYLPVIESALNPRAVSKAGATGLWQFMYSTGRMYNLKINSFIDERKDPVKATYAACRFLKDLYNIYNDWILVIAAYNCGPGNVNKAIRRSGGKKDYWEIYYYLPRETRGYVPAFIAAMYACNYYQDHKIKPLKVEMPPLTDTLMIYDNLHLQQVAEVLNYPLDNIRNLNPQYRVDIIPGLYQPGYLRLPIEKIQQFIDLQDTIFNYRTAYFFQNKDFLVNPENYRNTKHHHYTTGTPAEKTKIYYTVKHGDNLGYISQWFNVSITDIKNWNGLTKNAIYSGQKLAIYVPNNKVYHYKKINQMSFSEKQHLRGKPIPAKETNNLIADNNTNDYIYYTVKKGDTLWDIAKQFPGVSETDIKNLNNINNGNKIIPGQKIKIKSK